MILAAVAMLAPQAARRRGRRRCRDRAAGRRAAASSTIGASGPRSHSPIGASKPCLGRSTIACGMRRSSSRRSRYLLRPFFSFSAGRHRRGELEQLVIEQRLARFERHGHAHPVDLGHDVVDEIGLHVDVQRAVERIASTGTRRRRWRKPANGSASRTVGGEVARVERVARVRLEQPVGVLARAGVGGRQRQMPERPRALHAERQRGREPPGERGRRSARASGARSAPTARRGGARSRPTARRRRRPTARP